MLRWNTTYIWSVLRNGESFRVILYLSKLFKWNWANRAVAFCDLCHFFLRSCALLLWLGWYFRWNFLGMMVDILFLCFVKETWLMGIIWLIMPPATLGCKVMLSKVMLWFEFDKCLNLMIHRMALEKKENWCMQL